MMVSEKDEPYIEMSDVLTSHMREITYMIVNNSVTPKAVFRVPRTMSLLQWVAPYGRIKHDSIIGSIQHSSSRWVVMLEGNLEACPGKDQYSHRSECLGCFFKPKTEQKLFHRSNVILMKTIDFMSELHTIVGSKFTSFP